jgi:ubiquinol-cytochrome c reductase cytochrome b subunit
MNPPATTARSAPAATVWSLLRSPVPPRRHGWLAFGWPLLLLFAAQVFTGILLSFYYEPSAGEATESTRRIMRDVDWGWLVRGIHHWSAQLTVGFALLQLLRTLLTRAWQRARAASWYVGVALLPLVLLLAYTGELLKWDATAQGTVAQELDAVARLPAVGPTLAALIRGGEQVTATTLSRIHSAHTQLLPWFVFVLVTFNLVLLARRRRPAARPPGADGAGDAADAADTIGGARC